MDRGVRAAVVALLASWPAHAQPICTESQPCLHVIGSPGVSAAIATHRLLLSGSEIVWSGFVDLHALDLSTGHTRTLPHCGTVITDVALDGGYVYVLADRSLLCRVALANPHVQMLVNAPNVSVWGFAVSSSVVAYARRYRGGQPEMQIVSSQTGQLRSYPTWVTVENVVADASSVYWIDAGFLTCVTVATGAKTVGPRLTDRVTRLALASGTLYAATAHDVLRLDAAGRSWVTVETEGAEDLVASGQDVYAALSKGVLKIGAVPTLIAAGTKPYALALDASSLFIVEDSPFVIKQLVPR